MTNAKRDALAKDFEDKAYEGISISSCFIAGYSYRDAEVAELREQLDESNERCKQLKIAVDKSTCIIEAERAKIARLEAVIKKIDLTLRVPAAEYVPAIQDVFKLIDDAILEGK